MMLPLRTHGAAATDTGVVRKENEDSYAVLPEFGLWVVADGMGGHEDGKYASAAIVAALQQLEPPADLEAACAEVAETLHLVNARLFAEATALDKRMGSTFVALLTRDREFAVLWAGDSRAYVFRGGALVALTRDHSQVQEMVDRGMLTPDDAATHPLRHVLTRALGAEATLEIEGVRDEALPGDLFLLCSDGLYGVLEDREIADLLANMGTASVDSLIAACIARGAPDNVTVAIVSVSEPTALSRA